MSQQLATLIGQRFIQRKDVKAVQFDKGYTPDCTKRGTEHHCGVDCQRIGWTKENAIRDLTDHINGKKTYGHYMVGTDNTVKLFAFDIDLKKSGYWYSMDDFESEAIESERQECNPRSIYLDDQHPGWPWLNTQLRCLAEGLAIRTRRMTDSAYPVQIAYSGGKGLHVYCFTGTIDAADAKASAIGVLQSFGCFEATKGDCFYRHSMGKYQNMDIEVFPKQGNLDGKEFGNLMRLPLGVHRGTGKKAFFVDTETPYDVLVPLDPIKALEGKHQPWGI